MATIPNQATVKDNSNFEIDIDKVYADYIVEIDNARSIVNISTGENVDKLKTISEKSLSGLAANLKVENSPQESRCHAFYRLIGFPVINKDGTKMYNPGFDNVKNPDKKLTYETKISIANDALPGFNALSIAREQYTNSIKDIFNNNSSLDAAVLALSSSIRVRNFADSFKSDDPLDVDPNNQQYFVDYVGVVGNANITLTTYVDAAGKIPQKFTQFLGKKHIIRPFLVDPRIDFTVNPAKNRVSVPFVNSKTDLKMGETDYVKRPLIEKIIRERFQIGASEKTIGFAVVSIIDYLKQAFFNQSGIAKNEELIKEVAKEDGVYKTSNVQQFNKYLNIIKAMVSELVKAQKIIENIQSKYYWLPIPNPDGPEKGSSSQPVFQDVPEEFRTPKDLAIVNAQIKSIIDRVNSSFSHINSSASPDNFAFDAIKTTFDNDTSKAYGDVADKALNELIKSRDHDLKQAANALRKIEVIMGEFSGLGLCDIIAVIGALHIMPSTDLLGFLDEDAYDRMTSLTQFKGIPAKPEITTTLASFNKTIKDIYVLMDNIYIDVRENNSK